ncbi:MAG: HAD-IIB family hydrolase [Xanthomonadales bacterium]|nr:HAD-IIB family hydrolase [Gammaproteobacteria bacterium]MBT8052316.1 HAD-IIB family hydrolase [Gammaproteobacteria bacterium]NND55968.1 HAD-IIB family hydrolase [Xanthomonadales bacterium]NNK51540.1 HAD-IIB family hydrolase [Xanthomonadales bacterium]
MTSENPKLHILLISIHGLIRGENLELGRDADTGGQTLYVVELARALGERDDVEQVDLVTRRIVDPAVGEDYALAEESLSGKARIIRIDAGPEEYIPKEQLWDHLDSFTDNLVDWIREQPRVPDIVHSHYADAGYVGVKLANLGAIPLVHTGHSLGRDKRKQLLAKGLNREQIEATYNMSRRINAEEELLANADLVITSTRNEIESQYGLYNYYDPACMMVIPPGTNLKRYHPPPDGYTSTYPERLKPFLTDPDKPLVMALSRPDERKNIPVLLEAFSHSERLRQAANLLLIAGNRDDVRDLDAGAQSVLTQILLDIDAYDLQGLVAVPKRHSGEEIPDVYRFVAASGGVFVNPALTEPFGLTLLEAAASGLPLVATENGGPVDIISNCENGILVDPLDAPAIADALLELLTDRSGWKQAVRNGLKGVRRHYTWQAHAATYVEKLRSLCESPRREPAEWKAGDSSRYRDRALFTDIDQTLLGDAAALKTLTDTLRRHHRRIAFGIVSGRRFDSVLAVLKKHAVPMPDVLISSLGTRIHYGSNLTEDSYWADHIDHDWNRPRIRRVLNELPGLELQPRNKQSRFKLSYFYDPDLAPSAEQLSKRLHQHELNANVIMSFGQYLDIVPTRASKGQALRYAALRLEIPLEQILVAGGSGADEGMIRGNTLAVVVANRHEEELSGLVDVERIYFSDKPHAGGLLDAIDHYGFLENVPAA